METVWDWVTVFAFAGLVTLMIQRSMMDDPPDSLWHYAPPAVGCAIVNYIGNEGWNLLAGIGLLAVATYTYRVLKISLPKL